MKEYTCSHHNYCELEQIVFDLRREAYHAHTIDNAITNEENETARRDLSYTPYRKVRGFVFIRGLLLWLWCLYLSGNKP